MKKLMLGNEAVARGAYEAGCTVAAAYPGTPSTEITENIALYNEIYSEWSPNEKVALEVACGASICSMKHVGLNVAADPLFTASYTGVNGGLVIMVADDPGMHSSQNEQDSRHYAIAAKLPMLEPSDSSECKEFVRKAFLISEKYDTPVIIRLTTRTSHARGLVEIGSKEEYVLKDYKKDFNKYVMMPAMARKRHVFVEERMKQLSEYSDQCDFNYIELGKNRKTGVITSGIAYQYSKEAFGDISYLKLGMVHPIPEKLIREFAASVDTVYIIEELDPVIEEQILAMGIKNVHGKDILPVTGEYSASLLREKVLKKESSGKAHADESLPVRPPVMCPGCPHRAVFYVLKKLGLTVSGDIGCYTLGALPPTQAMDTCICMGASIGVAHGMEKARGLEFGKKTVAVIGDSTFIHSGVSGIINIAYNSGTSTVLILDNSTTGMTGHQHNPTTGYNIKGDPAAAVNLELLAKACGINRVKVVDPFDLKEFEKTVKEEVNSEEPSIIIARRPCALLKTVNYGKPLRVNNDKCKYCKLCLKLGCPAIVEKDGRITVNEALCNGCSLCAGLCSFKAFERTGEQL